MSYATPPFLTSVIFLLAGLLSVYKNPTRPTNRALALLCVTTFVWQFTIGLLLITDSESVAHLLVKIVYSWVIFIPISFYHFMEQFGGTKFDRILVRASYISGLIFLILLWTTPLFISGVYRYSWGYYPKAGVLHPLYLVLHIFIQPIRGLYVMFKAARDEGKTAEERRPAQYVGASVLAYYPAATDFINNYGAGFYPLGFVFTLFSLFIIGYAVVKHNLLDITIFVRKGLIYSALVTGITLLYLASIFITEFFFRGLFGYQSLLFTVIFACIVALLFQPIKNRIQLFLDRRFFKGTVDTLADENRRLQEEMLKAEKLRIAGFLASGIAHEIKNPLTNFKSFLAYLEEKHGDPSFRKKFREVVGREIHRVDLLVKDLLNFAKPESPRLETLDIHRTMDRTFEFVNTALASSHISLARQYHRPNTEIMGDPNQLQQAFLNIFLNAMDAMPNGGELRISTQTDKDHLIIRIEDTGCGMTKEQLEHIFEPFYTSKEGGTGLGLAITKRIIEDHKGKIKVTSEENKGTSFEILLPLAKV